MTYTSSRNYLPRTMLLSHLPHSRIHHGSGRPKVSEHCNVPIYHSTLIFHSPVRSFEFLACSTNSLGCVSRMIRLLASASPFHFCPSDFHLCLETQLKAHQLRQTAFASPLAHSHLPGPVTPCGIHTEFSVLTSCSHSQMERHSPAGAVGHKALQSARHIVMLHEFKAN